MSNSRTTEEANTKKNDEIGRIDAMRAFSGEDPDIEKPKGNGMLTSMIGASVAILSSMLPSH